MKTSLLVDYLEERAEPEAVCAAIAPAIARRRREHVGGAGSFPVLLQDDGGRLDVGADHLRILCRDFLAGLLDEVEIAYIATVIELSPSFDVAPGHPARAVAILAGTTCDTPRFRTMLREMMQDLL